MKLKLKIVKFEKALAVQVLEMDERFRSKSKMSVFISSNGFKIFSDICPCLDNNIFYLRGKNVDGDFDIAPTSFKCNIERDEYLFKMLEALDEWSEKWKMWKEEKEDIEDEDIYVF